MKIKSKSTTSFNKYKSDQIRMRRAQVEELYQKQAILDILQDKIARSKPILQTIYNKMKKKEVHYEQSLRNIKLKIQRDKTLNEQYKQLYQEGLRIMDRNKLIDRFKRSSNYREIIEQKYNQEVNPQKEYKHQIIHHIKELYHNKTNKSLNIKKQIKYSKENYKQQRNKENQLKITKQEIYKIYKKKLDQSNEKQFDKNSIKTATKQFSTKLLKQMDQDLIQLQQRKKRSKTDYNKSKISKKDDLNLKEQFAKLQKQKLHKI